MSHNQVVLNHCAALSGVVPRLRGGEFRRVHYRRRLGADNGSFLNDLFSPGCRFLYLDPHFAGNKTEISKSFSAAFDPSPCFRPTLPLFLLVSWLIFHLFVWFSFFFLLSVRFGFSPFHFMLFSFFFYFLFRCVLASL